MITPTQDPIFVAVRAFVVGLIPGVEVVQGLTNLTPMPVGEFICLTATAQKRLATNHITYSGTNEREVKQPTEYSIQVDCYGPNASDYATTLSAMWRDDYGCIALESIGAPLYSTDATQMPLVNGEQNYEQRFTFTALLQFNPVVTVPQQYADELNLNLVEIDATYPPT